MIPKYQRITYWTLIGLIALMFLLLIRGCVSKHQRISAMRDESRIPAPTDLPAEQVSVALANDADASITMEDVTMPVPADESLRAKVILDRMFADFAQPASTHHLPAGPAVTDVFLLPLPVTNPSPDSDDVSANQSASPYGHVHAPGDLLAVVNLTKAFADSHPSGIETEDLTLRATISTLHANSTAIQEVRFLVDGQTRDTLAGHADLRRPYAVLDPTQSIHELSAFGNPM
jgi:hypothetical protein